MTNPVTPAEGTVHLEFNESGQVATITVDREAKLNAFTPTMLTELEAAARKADDSGARLVILRTAGTRVFCVGADIGLFAGLTPVEMWRDWTAVGHRAFSALEAIRCITIAVIDGLAFGGGLELALACDFRIMQDDARVALPETGLGTVPGWGGTGRTTALIGPSRAKEMVLLRREVSAETALNWGLANDVAPAGQIDDAIERWTAETLAGSGTAIALGKQLVTAAAAGAPASIIETLAGGLSMATADLPEGISAFRGKRTPEFTGA